MAAKYGQMKLSSKNNSGGFGLPSKLFDMTTLMQQYKNIKEKYPAAILLFRVGDFYETFNRDAEIASRILGLTLTKQQDKAGEEKNENEEAKSITSLPHYNLDTALHKLVKAGYQVGVCDQLEIPKPEPMKRGVIGFDSHRA